MKKYIFIILGLIAGFLLLESIFIISHNQQFMIIRHGKPVTFKNGDKEVKFLNSPGLKFKLPFIDDVKYFPSKVLYINTLDKVVMDTTNKAFNVRAVIECRIVNPLVFYEQKVMDKMGIHLRLDQIFDQALRNVNNIALPEDFFNKERNMVIEKVENYVSAKAMDLGIEITDLRIIPNDNNKT